MKKFLAALLVAALCLTLLAACASGNKSAKEDAPTENPAQTQTEAPNEEDTPEIPDDEEDEPEEITEINYVHMVIGTLNNTDAVTAAINEITEAEIGVHVNIEYLSIADLNTQVPIKFAGGEVMDLCDLSPMPSTSVASLYSNGQVMDITDLLDTYGQGIKAALGDFIYGDSLNGRIYGVPTYRQCNSNGYLVMRQDILEELGLQDKAVETWADVEEIYESVKTNTDLWPNSQQVSVFLWQNAILDPVKMTGTAYDTAGDGLGLVIYKDGALTSLWEDEDYLKDQRLAAKWNEMGYIYPESAIENGDGGDERMHNNLIFSQFTTTEFGSDASKVEKIGHPLKLIEVFSGMVTTSSVSSWGTFIPTTAEEPEAAMKFLNLLYTNEKLITTLCWGVEGEDYLINENGEGVYPEGKEISSVNYHSSDWICGNQFLILPWVGQGGDFRARAEENLKAAAVSSLMGFVLDTGNLSTELAALTQVTLEYKPTLRAGGYTDELNEEFLNALYAAGFQTYMDTINAQLDDWLNK